MSGNYSADRLIAAAGGPPAQLGHVGFAIQLKAGCTPNGTDEYTIDYIKQLGEKGAPPNVYNNPPVPPNSYWRWPYWDVQNTSFLSRTQFGPCRI